MRTSGNVLLISELDNPVEGSPRTYRRLIISQDKDETHLALASYPQEYLEYIQRDLDRGEALHRRFSPWKSMDHGALRTQ